MGSQCDLEMNIIVTMSMEDLTSEVKDRYGEPERGE
jgi:hypothetical protein